MDAGREGKIMNMTGRLACAAACAALVAGCTLEERMVWSPDGTRAAVRVAGDLRLADPEGGLSDPIASDVTAMAWLPDGRGLALLRTMTVTNWSEVVRLAPPSETVAIAAVAHALPPLLRVGMEAAGGDLDVLAKEFLTPLHLAELPYAEAMLCLRDTRPDDWAELVRLMSSATKGRDSAELADDMTEMCRAVVYEIGVLALEGDKPAGPMRVLERGMRRLAEPRPSPTAPVLAFLRDDTLTLAPLEGEGGRAVVAERVTGHYDWTPDGRSLVFAVRSGKTWDATGMNLAHIQRREALDPDGEILPGRDELLAVSLFTFLPRVRSLPDGRVLFAGVSASLPAGPDPTGGAGFHIVSPPAGAAPKLTPVPSEAGALPSDLSGFSVSPDGRRVAVAEAGSDAVAVLDLETGRLEVVAPRLGSKSRTLPSWRPNGELYYAARDTERADWRRWTGSAAPPAPVSAGWPEALTRDLLETPDPGYAGEEPGA